jgi:hypothetical protein
MSAVELEWTAFKRRRSKMTQRKKPKNDVTLSPALYSKPTLLLHSLAYNF